MEYRLTGTRTASGAWELRGPCLNVPITPGRHPGEDDTPDAVELLLAAVAADVLAGARRAALALRFEAAAAEVHVTAVPGPGRGLVLGYELHVATAEPEPRLAQLHAELRRLAPVLYVVGSAVQLTGRVRHRPARTEQLR